MDERAPSVAVDRTPTRRERYWFVSAGCTRGARAPPPARWMTDPLRHRRPRARDMLGTAEHAAGIANAFAHRRDLASHDASAAADRRDPLGGRAGPLARHDPGPRASRERTRAGRGVADDDRVRRLARPARRRNARARLDDRGDAGQPEERFRSPRRVDQDQHAAACGNEPVSRTHPDRLRIGPAQDRRELCYLRPEGLSDPFRSVGDAGFELWSRSELAIYRIHFGLSQETHWRAGHKPA